MTGNNIRFDLSDWLIHFFRDIDLDGNNPIDFPEHMGWSNIAEDTKYPALFMLRCALRHGKLWATWAIRGGVRTIYGPSPAVCFSEMPIAAFLEAGAQRQRRGEAMSPYALIFPKNEMFRLGANPVIYGLDDRNTFPLYSTNVSARMFPNSVLPSREQYRYVTYNPASERPIDWTHEREWRWPYRADLRDIEDELSTYGIISDYEDMPGLEFFKKDIQGIGVVVETEEQVEWIVSDILTLVDRKIVSSSTYSFILPANLLPPTNDMITPSQTADVINRSLINISPFLESTNYNNPSIINDISVLANQAKIATPPKNYNETGECWLWILDNNSTFCRTLLYANLLTISNSGKYLYLPPEFRNISNLREKEEATKNLAKLISKNYSVECGYHSVLDSSDPNGVPFYASDHIQNHRYYNVTWK